MRLAQFRNMANAATGKVPRYVLGYEEPDCAPGEGSAGMSVEAGVAKWEALIAPLRARGAKLGSPAMCSECLLFLRTLIMVMVMVMVGRTSG